LGRNQIEVGQRDFKMTKTKDLQTAVFYWSLVFISSVAALLNITVLRMFTKFRKNLLRKSAHNRILFSLCFADLLVGVFGTSLGILLLLGSSPKAYKLAGNIPLFSCMFASVLSLALLTADRLLAVKKPFIYGTSGYLIVMNRLLFVIWCVPSYVALQQVVIYLQISSPKELQVRSLFFVVFFCVGFTSLIITNSMLYKFIRDYTERRRGNQNTASNYTNESPSPDAARENNDVARDPVSCDDTKAPKAFKHKISGVERELRQTSIMCIIIVASFLVLWTPLAVYRLLYAVEISLNLAWMRRLCLCLTVSNSVLNPVIYLSFRRMLRAYFIKLFKPSIGRVSSVRVM